MTPGRHIQPNKNVECSKFPEQMIQMTKDTHRNLKIDFGDIAINCKIELVKIVIKKYHCTMVFLR